MIKEMDSILLCLPSAVCGALGVGMRYVEETEVPVIKEIGWLGSRSAIVVGTLCGTPLLVWTFAKAAFTKLCNGFTGGHFETLRGWEKHCNDRLNLVFQGLPLYPIFCMHMPSIIKSSENANELQQKMTEEIRLISNKISASAQHWKL